ncbi:hypothetical protein BOTBODRAFT_443660 [Botryobasidium botryosum FD-172 SS1]|uniref:Uncharacterized protein n=1 Tax=Botryobasidium botryosum (strain FD-172 SS1) TaxID=930990 RepID=A0A067N733_BOTB1|nr:hypothetical protein BOTBODRAFT_443660 [Botryobasidium botryosum FD-172 SS1]
MHPLRNICIPPCFEIQVVPMDSTLGRILLNSRGMLERLHIDDGRLSWRLGSRDILASEFVWPQPCSHAEFPVRPHGPRLYARPRILTPFCSILCFPVAWLRLVGTRSKR